MQTFRYAKANNVESAGAILSADTAASYIAGGTELLNWMKIGISSPHLLVDINRLPLAMVQLDDRGLHIGALARMSDVAAHPEVQRSFPAVSQSLLLSASPQLRNMASMGGNLLQRTRCPYFRAESATPCNKRRPGSGCAAIAGDNRNHAIFGWSEQCVATHPSDVAVALAALDAQIRVRTGTRERMIPITDFHRVPGEYPERDNVLEHGDLIVAMDVPASPMATHSWYLKIRERSSYEFALVSVAVGLDLDGDTIRTVRIALGGVAPKPWRLRAAEEALHGVRLERAALRTALDHAFEDARPLAQNAFKVELAKRIVVRALETARGQS